MATMESHDQLERHLSHTREGGEAPMNSMHDGLCFVHNFEVAEARCRNCGNEFCNECLVYAFGPSKPPYCVGCALAAAGVRSNAGRQPTLSRREIRRLEKERRRAQRQQPEPVPQVEVNPADFAGAPVGGRPDDPFAWADDPNFGQRVPY
jgi:hypothetical protein